MPIKYQFILKTVVRGSENIETPASILKQLNELKLAAVQDDSTQDAGFEILVSKKGGVISDDLYTEGKLTDTQSKIAQSILSIAKETIKSAPGDDEKIKIKFTIKK
jgi:hypothetical protein